MRYLLLCMFVASVAACTPSSGTNTPTFVSEMPLTGTMRYELK